MLLFIFFCILFVLSETAVEKESHPDVSLVKNQTASTGDISSKTVTSVDSETQSTCDKSDEKTANDSENKSDSGVSVDTQSDTKESEADSGGSVERSESVKISSESSVIQRTRIKSDEKLVVATPSISLPKTEDSKDKLETSGKVNSPISPISPHSPQFSFEEDPMPGKFNIDLQLLLLFTVPFKSELKQKSLILNVARESMKRNINICSACISFL